MFCADHFNLCDTLQAGNMFFNLTGEYVVAFLPYDKLFPARKK